MNIKNEEVHRLVEELANLTGESQTAAVRHAVEEKLLRVRADRELRHGKLMAIAKQCAAGIGEPVRSLTHEELDNLLYDEKGLPR